MRQPPDSIGLLLDFKAGNINQLITFLNEQNAYSRQLFLHSNKNEVHKAIKQQGSKLTTIASCYTSFNMFNCIEEKRPHIANFVWERVNDKLMLKAKQAGYLIELNTIGLFHSETEVMLTKAIAYQPDFILTNEPAKVKQLLKKLNLR